MTSSASDQQVAVGAKILYKLNLKSPRRGTVLEKERNRDKWSVAWEDGTTASVSLKAQQHDAWELIDEDAAIAASPHEKSAPEAAADEVLGDDDKQHPPIRNEQDLEQEANELPEIKGEVETGSDEKTSAAPENPSSQYAEAEAGDAFNSSTDTVEESKEEAPDSGKKKEKKERLARLYQRMGTLIGDKAAAASSNGKNVESAAEDKMDSGTMVPTERKEESVSPEKDRSASDKKSKAQELIARLKARTESSMTALGAHSTSSGPEAKRGASDSVLHKRTRSESPSDGLNASHHPNRFKETDDLVSLGAALLTETRGHLNGGTMYCYDAIKRARYDLDFDFDGSGSGSGTRDLEFSSVNAMKQFCGSRDLMKKERKNFPKETVDELKKWFEEHIMHPYPDDSDKDKLAEKTGLTTSQVSYWFVNARKRIWQPMLADRQQATLQGYAKVTAADVMLRGICKKHSSGSDWGEPFDLYAAANKGLDSTAESAAGAGEGGAALAELIAGQVPPGAPVPVARTSPANVDA